MVSAAALNSIFSTMIMKRPTINYGSFIAIIIIISVFYEADCQSLHRSSYDYDQSSIVRVKRQSTRFNNQIKLQRFLIEPENVTVDIGESIQLPCRVSNKAGTVQWTRDGFGLGADPRLEGFPTYSMLHNDATGDYSLKISSVTLEDDAIFQCQVGAVDNVPGIRSQNARLTVRVRPEDPVIVLGNLIPYHHHLNNNLQQQELQVLSTTAGNKIELTCESHGGRPAAELSWINSKNRVVKKGITSKITPMNDGKRYNVALKWQFEPTKNDHQKRLYCRASHPTYVTSNTTSPMTSIMLEVKYAPEVKLEVSRVIDQQPPSQPLSVIEMSNLHGRVGDTLRFRCVADGNPGKNSMVYEWLRNNEVIIGDHGQELVIDNVDKSFNGAEIQCRVGNPVGTGQSSIKLNIAYGPYFLPSMEYVYGANLGDTVRLACAVDGNPTPEITWIKVGTSSVMSSGPKLTIRDVQPENVGEYLCRVSVKGFTEISAIVYLRLNGPPKIRKTSIVSSSTTSSSTYNLLYPFNDNNIVGAVQHHQQYYGKQSISSIPNNRFYAVPGESAHLECLVESVPAPIAITWIHNGQIFTSGSANNIPINIDIFEETVKEEMVVQRASFNIRQTFENDFGYYNCVVINSYGSDWHFISLEKKTSFSTIVIIVAIAISILMFVVLTTIILLLTIKHRNLLKQQRQQRHLQQQNPKSHNPESDGGDPNGDKEHYMAQILDSDNHNIYSTHSTRTNSSANYFIDKLNQPLETGTIITRSGSTGSQRSSTSSTFPVYLDHHRASSSSPGPGPVINDSNVGGGGGGIISRTINSLHNHQRRSSPNHASSNNHRPMSPPSYFNNSIFETSSTNNDLMMITSSNKSGPVIAMPPITSTNYSTLINKHLPNSNRNSYSPYLAQQFYQQQQQQQFDNLSQSNLGSKDPSANTNDMYQANPYSIVQSSSSAAAAAADKGFDSRIKSTPMPTRPPSIAKELDNCISNTSIATHV